MTSLHRWGLAPLMLLLAGWPVLVWALQRWSAPGESRWHLVPLAALAVAIWVRLRRPSSGAPPIAALPSGTVPWAVVALLWIYVWSLLVAPPLLQGLSLAAALAALLSRQLWGRTCAPGVWGALLLAVPSLPSLLFVFGYPWRRVTTLATAQLLRLSGLRVEADGTQLRWEGGTVAVDAPCSGLYMGWAVAVLLVVLWLFVDADLLSSLRIFGAALGLVLTVNVLRAAALFYLERLQNLPGPWTEVLERHPWHHEAIGMALFLPLCLALSRAWKAPRAASRDSVAAVSAVTATRTTSPRHRQILWALGLLVAAALPFWTQSGGEIVLQSAFPGWPQTVEGRSLQPLPLTPREARFADGFPGRVGRFHDGEREIILRWLDRPTRKLHPAVECFRAHGYRIDHRPWQLDAQGRPWSSFEAHLPSDDASLRVRERVLDADGRQWADVSSWYWAALLGRSRGPWWSTVVAESVDQSSVSSESPGDGI